MSCCSGCREIPENAIMIIMRFRLLLAVAAAVLFTSSCKSQYELLLQSNNADEKYDAAFSYFNAGKYSKAASLFESLTMLVSGTEREDTVKYYWGLSNYKFKDYYTAETNFEQFISNYPRSPFVADASYLRIDCLYRSTLRYELDQMPTYKAMNAISEYILEYPKSDHMESCRDMLVELNERLDKKAYEAARLYYKMEDYLAAKVAFKNVLKDDAENIYREDILYHIAMSSYKYAIQSILSKQKERYLAFIDDYYNFIGELPESHYRRELDNVYYKVQKALGRKGVETDAVDMDERDFAKERRKLMKQAKKTSGAEVTE
jgi:outer membrane protein assembly factor BamD